MRSAELSIIVPTYKERGNVAELVRRLDAALAGLAWEAVFVDDNSPDGTAAAVKEIATEDSRVRCLRRVGRRGLAGACIEGMLSSSAPYVAVIDADLQHDEKVLPQMLATLKAGGADLVAATRYVEGGSAASFSEKRGAISRLATRMTHRLVGTNLSDPMSGFFMMRRDRLEEVAPRLSPVGFKILLDIAATAGERLRIAEQPYQFGERFDGESKFDAQIGVEFLGLLLAKMTGDLVDPRFIFFAIVGTLGLIIHLITLKLALAFLPAQPDVFRVAQIIATLVAMSSNFVLNNELTYRDRRLKGAAMLQGFVLFCLIGSVGVLANVDLASWLYFERSGWWMAGAAGAIMTALWNYAMSTLFVSARAMISPRRAGFLIAALISARALIAMLLPLSADEAYYWLWSKHLDFGYFDHPPAIAWLIRAGTLLLGDSPIGVRASGIVLSVAASWLVFESALAILKDRSRAWLAALLFNLTLMVSVEMLAATPDMPSVASSALFLFALARLQQTQKARWWLAVGAAGGLGMLSKYSAGFLGLGALVWLLADTRARHWLKTPWLWAGGFVALLVFLPNLLWQATHQWETFAFQFGRTLGNQWTARFLIEFAGAQLGLATPGIFILGIAGFCRVRRGDDRFLLWALMLPAIAYFLIHALHDRVQGNWPSFLFPVFALLAADAFGGAGRLMRWTSRLAMPLAGLILLLVYAQALTGFVPLGKGDPLARLLGLGFRPVADSLPAAARAARAGAVLTTDYETTAWLRFYEPGLVVIQAGEPWRYPNAPSPSLDILSGPLLYVVEQKRDQHALLGDYFRLVEPVTVLQIKHNGRELSDYAIYRVEGMKTALPSKMP